MAASVLRKFNINSSNSFKFIAVLTRNISKVYGQQRIVPSDDRKTVVCWHPEEEFPYECSLPITEDVKPDNSVLKVQNVKDLESILAPKHDEFVRKELMDLTYTTKHKWFPEGIHKRRRKRKTEYSRPYL